MSQKSSTNSILKAEQVYHFDMWNEFSYFDEDLHSITLHCCSVTNGFFFHTILGDSDWDSCQVENCKFQKLSLENSDITSTYFENCKFLNVSFKGTTTTDITFTNCEFEDCNFDHISLSNSIFVNCLFTKLKLRQSTTTLNTFTNCQFISSKIGGNFLYNIFSTTHFEKTQMEHILMASNFGFSINNFEELSWDQIDHKLIQQNLLDNKDIISAAIISLNIENNFYDYSILACVQVIINQLKKGILVRAEQLLFIKAIIYNLLKKQRLSLYTVLHILNLLETTKSINNNIAVQKAELNIQQLISLLFEHYHYMINQIHNDIEVLDEKGKLITLKITYQQEPCISLCHLLEQIMIRLGIPKPYPIRTKTAVGSFVEWIQSYDNILKCLQLIISILGLGVNLKKIYPTKNIMVKQEVEDIDESDASLIGSQIHSTDNAQTESTIIHIPDSVIDQICTVSTEQNVHQVINVLIDNNITVNNNFQGYSSHNLKNIEIL